MKNMLTLITKQWKKLTLIKTMKNMITLLKTMKKWQQFVNPTKAFGLAFSFWISINISNNSSYNRISFDIFDPFDDFILENMLW